MRPITYFLSIWFVLLLLSNDLTVKERTVEAVEAISQTSMPLKRRLLQLPYDSKIAGYKSSTSSMPLKEANLRVLQFNVLADGLSGLRDDLGLFSRAKEPQLNWSTRKWKLMHEITQYDPDIITLQEVDHYYDFLLPELSARGYTGLFSPKPTSKCLEVSRNADGCALFVKNHKLRIKSCETATLALSKAEMNDEGEIVDDDIRAQNQVALLAICELIQEYEAEYDDTVDDRETAADDLQRLEEAERFQTVMTRNLDSVQTIKESISTPPIIVCTTHLKSAKCATGERYRKRGIEQVLSSVTTIYNTLSKSGRTPAVLLTGDFNAQPEMAVYGSPETYRAIQRHPLNLRSVYNEDVDIGPVAISANEFYTTWKACVRGTSTEEIVIKRCIDYIFYKPFVSGNLRKNIIVSSSNGNENSRSNGSSSSDAKNKWVDVVDRIISTSFLTVVLRFCVYSMTSLFGFSATFLSTDLSDTEKGLIALIFGTLALLFEVSNYSKPITSATQKLPLMNGKKNNFMSNGDAVFQQQKSLDEFAPANKRRKYAVARSTSTLLKSVVLRLSIYIICGAFILVLLANGIENSNEQAMERSFGLCVALASFVILYESTAVGTPFKAVADPDIALREGSTKVDNKIPVIPLRSAGVKKKETSAAEDDQSTRSRMLKSKGEVSGKVFDYSSKLLGGISRQLTTIGQWIQPQYGNPGFVACAAADVYSSEEIGPDYIPSDSYPSDHLALVADLKLLWESSADTSDIDSSEL